MITRAVQRKRPRWPALLVMGGAVVAAGLFATVAFAALVSDSGTYDLTVPNNNTSTGLVSVGAASVEYIGSSASNQASGTGLFDPFVRLQGSPTEQGYNTCSQAACGGDVSQFDTKTGTWTHAIKVSAIPVVDCDGTGSGTALCWELFNDINDNNTAKRISLNAVQIFFTDSAVLTGYTPGSPPTFSTPAGNTTTEEYNFTGNILLNDVNQGSGRGDLRYLVPIAGHPFTSATYFVLYSLWGTTSGTAGNFGTGGYSSDGGFEEWKVRKTPNVSIVKTANPVGPVSAGTAIGFDITISNTGVADATNVTISDPLPAGGDLDWSLSPAFSGCSITGAVGAETLNCTFATLAAGASVGPIHITSATTQADCALVSNTATVASGNDGGGSSTDTVTVQCAAIKILKESTKTGNPLVLNAGAVFSYDGSSVTDNGTGDEDSTIGSVCVGGLAPGTYTVNETSAPTGYGSASQTNLSAVAVQGTNCTSNLPTGTGVVTFTNPPLGEIGVTFKDLGSGETNASIVCAKGATTVDAVSENNADDPAFDDTDETFTNLDPGTYTCTVVVDP